MRITHSLLALAVSSVFSVPLYAASGFSSSKPSSVVSAKSLSVAKVASPKSVSAPAAAPRTTAPAPVVGKIASPPPVKTSGFSQGKGAKIAKIGAATGVGAALYAAGAHEEALAAYHSANEASPVVEPTAKAADGVHVSQKPVAEVPSQSSAGPISSPPAPQKVIVVKERTPDDSAYWYMRGRESAHREQAATQASVPTSIQVEPNTYPGVPVQRNLVETPVQRNQPSESANGQFTFVLMVFITVAVLAVLGLVMLNFATHRQQAVASMKPKRKANYTLN